MLFDDARKTVRDRARDAPTNVQSGGVTLDDVHKIMTEERLKAAVRNNVLISPVQEDDGEDLRAIILDLVPDMAHHEFDAVRVGRASEGSRPRLLLVRTTGQGKRLLMSMRGLKYKNSRVYVNHDLTRAEREERKHNLPKFRSLRAASAACSFPRDKVIRDGKVMSDAEIEAALSA